jgi:UDP-glucose 4-epimerase
MKGKRILLTGGAGFIGSNMLEALIRDNEVTVFDNFSNVDNRYIRKYEEDKHFSLHQGDLALPDSYKGLGKFDVVIHLAANSDVKNGAGDPGIDYRNNVEATFRLLEFMRKEDVREMLFSSSSTVYGETTVLPTPESYGPYMPISSYGASKMSCEGFITAYSNYYGFRSTIFRFANIVGKNSTHGVIYDFIRKLQKNQSELEVLGDGTQRKSYVHVSDCVNSMLYIHDRSRRTDIYNLGNPGTTGVKRIAEIVLQHMKLTDTRIRYTGGEEGRGWKGDVKVAQLDITKMLATGWKNTLDSEQSVVRATKETLSQMGIA